jgi:hypothetical protein
MPDVTVSLNNKKISVDKSRIQASVSKSEKVQWNCPQGPFAIVFKSGSNWPNPPAAKEKNGVWSAESGPFNRPNTTLSYSITATGYDELDPDIDVIP